MAEHATERRRCRIDAAGRRRSLLGNGQGRCIDQRGGIYKGRACARAGNGSATGGGIRTKFMFRGGRESR
jgi:hypothetical protein